MNRKMRRTLKKSKSFKELNERSVKIHQDYSN